MKLLKRNDTILVVDDDDSVRDYLSFFLTRHGYNVIEAENGQVAVDKYKQHNDIISVVLMDLDMPIKNGIDASYEIMEYRPDAKIILVSGYLQNYMTKIIVFDFIQKPYSPLELLKRIRQRIDA